MRFCKGEHIARFAEKMISPEHQVHHYSIDLTVAKVYVVKKAGDIDFGGSELKKATIEEVRPSKRSSDDEHGWWRLNAGEYIIEYNEKVVVPDGCFASIQPLPNTLQAGVMHPTLTFASGEKVDMTVLLVGKSGFNVKQNARISSLRGMAAD